MSDLKITQLMMTQSPCYTSARRIVPAGIVVHSTGANNPRISRYVQPDDGVIGVNTNNNHWNKPTATKGVHAFIGKDKNGVCRVYQVLPWDRRAWGVGSGKNGSYNNTHIQFEICEDNLENEDYYLEAFGLAAQLCAYLCQEFGIPVHDVVGHYEAHATGYANNHGDPRNWMPKHGDSMDKFRRRVADLLGKVVQDVETVRPVLRRGDADDAVTDLQLLLMQRGYKLPEFGPDGDFGKETETAVKAFQRANGLEADGIVGRLTWAVLESDIQPEPLYAVTIERLTRAQADNIIAQYGGTLTGA